ncbi:TetR/AcrR family transcriptional regulator [Streptomyces sp. NPDC058682]|uniref:TetR/AcrR family transcriptional regulator n=1 Tax=unclassified Streptomyces TaxID=2593676 RepID=UPI0022513D8A|nr:TetR/AcrR family transcriptional regulator [Streptomyces sp. NBC_01214]MCX4803036.1 TetR/AcrR family transcriptional regulator [Streptomyces sp. NBC_01214]
MSSPSTPARGRPARLDRDRTVDTALELLDDVGLDALTMRRLADAMDVQAGALYRYFATKDELLTAMAERMLVDVAATGTDGDWSERLAALARAMRTALLARRDGARVYAGTHATGPHTLGFAEAVVGVLRTAGFGEEDAARALMAVAHFTIGHTLEEQAALRPPQADGVADAERLYLAAEPERYPQLAAVLPTLTRGDFGAHFDFGLSLLLAGLRALDRGPTCGDGPEIY